MDSLSSSQEIPPVRRAFRLVLGDAAFSAGRLDAQTVEIQEVLINSAAPRAAAKPAVDSKPTAEHEISPVAEKFITQLGDADFRKRDAAAKELRQLSVKALGALRKAKDHPDAEVQRRVSTLLAAIETAVLLEPRRVTVHLKRKTARQIVDELQRQTGFQIGPWASVDTQLYDLDCDDLPFWEAFDRVCQSAGLVLQGGYGEEILQVNPQSSFVPHVCYRGAFRVSANSFNYSRNIDLSALPKDTGALPRNESLNFGFTVCVEPRIPLMAIGEARLTEALDDQGRSMALLGPSGDEQEIVRLCEFRHGGRNKTYGLQSHLNLIRPSEKSRSVKILKGSVPVTILASQKPEIVSDDILQAKDQKKRVGPVTFTILEASQKPNKEYELKLRITNNANDSPNDSTWMNSLLQRIELQDAKGNKYQPSNSSWGSAPNHAELSFTYDKPSNVRIGPPKTLVYYVWKLVSHEVEFEFKNLPLP
ncbi:MAG TPA: hypothetical protein VKE94_20085 [Gemmataceae bacterium]|nr:hypothetical protein [Gemmataceae bacterium]